MLFATLPGFAWFSLKIGSGVTALVRVDHKETIIDVVLFLHFALMLVQLTYGIDPQFNYVT